MDGLAGIARRHRARLPCIRLCSREPGRGDSHGRSVRDHADDALDAAAEADPVPDELISKILEAGACAANGGNTQRWRFLIIKDPKIKQAVQAWYKRAFDEVVGPRYASSAPPPGVSPERYKRQHSAVEYLTEHYHEAPVWIVACIDEGTARPTRWSGASIYPAVQNMLLAARALGLGSHAHHPPPAVREGGEAAMGLPEGVHSYAILPIGYPMGRFGPVGRGKLSDIVFQDKWGQPYPALN